MKKILVFIILMSLFFFGEIALTFSDKGYPSLLNDKEIPFSLMIDNEYSDHDETNAIDRNVNAFLKKWKVEGASVAVTKDEQLVYAKGFGTANDETGEKVKPGHLFRIASVSKLITAVAIMKLYEDGKLGLDDRVFGKEGILNDSVFLNYRDKRYEDITIRQLLNHTAGWSKYSVDPMFSSLYVARKMKIKAPAEFDSILQFALSRRLNYRPGTRYSYSNLGYGILGEIVARKSGMAYQDYVVMNILKPLDIHDMHIGRSYYQDKFPNEVRYHSSAGAMTTYSMDGSGEQVPIYYGGNNIELLGPAGGWVASAPELIKFLTAVDGFPEQPDILEPLTILQMSNPDAAGSGLFGWRGSDNYGTWWRTGYLTGSTALVVRQQDGLNWVVMMNTSTIKHSRIQRYVSGMMFRAVNQVHDWPTVDLFVRETNLPGPIAEIPATNPKL
ncbi:MAG: serine hydrolase domain-containing protein [Bacteroides sp.]|nr:serine hydrolase domain-containing protein [Bacteroides sp.]